MTEREQKRNGRKIPYCEEKQRLVNGFLDTSRVLMELQSQQTQAVIDGDPDFARFDDLIHMARESKDKAKYSLIAHMEEHCC
jgi:hypothetical protein